MPCCVNLPLRWVHDQPLWLDWFEKGRIHPEFGLDADSLYLPDAWHQRVAARFRGAGLRCAVHLPFINVDPCATDLPLARESARLLRRGAELAALYGATHMIGHPYCPEEGPRAELPPGWMNAALTVWPELPALGRAPLYLENTYELSMTAVAALAAAAGKKAPATAPPVGICFDLGHWRAFAGQVSVPSFLAWLDVCGNLPLHLHLHDNNGSGDQHNGLGRGDIPLEAIFAILAVQGKAVTATLEPHNVQSFSASIAWLEARPAIAQLIGWEKPLTEALPFVEIEKNLAK